ncbi:uncharacterized protein STEHIDRAFT_117290 [Stereum hirsutum FP-91666 SS1]|uniref:uncharacterized protein n=1 Tax=Stereum hirsutum (strain FP-91666) TaxID=721885 RepID=UPI000440AACB|nr:uncharacterized protein STEHIDRAFT_117290 [Stereum hirsutum FP-91666 SS1]EIM92233.1 hypothetical protein STEHIDRAFT_117290 [Stereum hirsutum FP-91666 SS1]
MENFISLAKEGYEKYQESQGGGNSGSQQYGKTGGAEYNTPSNSNGRNEGSGEVGFNHEEVIQTAQQHGSGDSSLFSSAMSFVNGNKQEHTQPVDEEAAQSAHRQAYHEGSASNLNASSMGSAAALQVLKQFTGGSGSGGGSQSQLISMAMAEASKLFDSSSGGSGGNKQEAVNGAAMTVMKLLVQSKFSGATGGSNSGGLSSMMSLASKFM